MRGEGLSQATTILYSPYMDETASADSLPTQLSGPLLNHKLICLEQACACDAEDAMLATALLPGSQLCARRLAVETVSGISLCSAAAIYNSYRGGELCKKGALSLLYTAAICNSYREGTLCRNGGPSLFDTAAIYNSYREGKLSVRMEAYLFALPLLYATPIEKACSVRMEALPFSLQLLYTTPIEKANSLSEWRPLTLLYSCYKELI